MGLRATAQSSGRQRLLRRADTVEKDTLFSNLGIRDGDRVADDPDDPGDQDDVEGSSFHGTHVAGTIAAASNNTTGVAGVA